MGGPQNVGLLEKLILHPNLCYHTIILGLTIPSGMDIENMVAFKPYMNTLAPFLTIFVERLP